MTDAEIIEDLEARYAYVLGTLVMLRGDDRPVIEGLGRKQTSIVNLLKRANGDFLRQATLVDAIWGDWEELEDELNCVSKLVHEIKVRRFDLWKHIDCRRGYGYRWMK